jgi:acetyl esterase/lipase
MKHLLTALLLLLSMSSFSQNKELISVWPGKVPGEIKEKSAAVIAPTMNDNVLRISEVTDPKIEIWLSDPKISNGASVIVCPGGGYRRLAYDKEGTEIAGWINKMGYSAFVLQYRVPDKIEGALQDIQRAMRIVRKNALKWNLDSEKIGVIGFSAGGGLCARASTLYNKKTYAPVDIADSLSCRPSFTMLIYPAYLDQGPNNSLTPELELNKNTPPIFLFQTADDFVGNSSLVMASALRSAKLPVELHYLATGGHGYGLRSGNSAAEEWPKLAANWMQKIINLKK